MKYIRLLAMVATALCVPTAVFAQNAWTLEQCIKYAWDNNITIRQQKLTSEQSANTLQQSKLNFIPSVGANASYNLGWGRSVNLQDLTIIENQLSQSFGPSISASINLFEGLQKFSTINRNSAEYSASVQQVELLRNQISLEIARAYLQVLLTKEVLATAEKSRESVAQQRETTKKLVDAGSQPHSTLLEIEAQLASENVQYVTAQNQVDIAYLALRQLLDLNSASNFEIAAPEIVVSAEQQQESVQELYGTAQDLPQIQVAKYRRESAKYATAIAKGQYWPTLSLSGSYGSYFNSPMTDQFGNQPNFWDQLHDNRNTSLSFGLNIPLFRNWSTVTNAKNAKLSYKIAELEVENANKTLYKEIQQAATDVAAAYNKYNAGEQNVAAMTESFRYTQQKFDIGMVTATDYTVAKNNLFKAQSDMLQSKYQYVFQLKILDFYKGIPLTL